MPDVLTCVIKSTGPELIYSDDIDLSGIGEIESVKRWSTIEFNQGLKEWEVRRVGSDEVLFTHRSRKRCLSFEHGLYNRVCKGEI